MSLNVNSPSKINNRRIFDSDIEAMKTKEFQRRRLLRLQQVREQSRDIAKKVRERADNENLRQIARIDQTKRDKFGQSRDKIVNELRSRCSDNLQHLGAGHSDAARETIAHKEEEARRRSKDRSGERGKTAASLLRQSKHLEEESKEKTLQRKLQARSLANERSRQNVNKLKSTKQSTEYLRDVDHNLNEVIKSTNEKLGTKHTSNNGKNIKAHKPVKHPTENNVDNNLKSSSISSATKKTLDKEKNMEWPWVEGDNAKIPSEWLSNPENRPSRDKQYSKGTSPYTDKKRRDLFTVSEEMPSSLRGRVSESTTGSSKMEFTKQQSINMVSSYLQDRAKRLPTTTTKSGFNKVSGEEMKNLKETIIRSKKLDVPTTSSGGLIDSKIICQVTDSQAVPVPCWKPVVVKVFNPVPEESHRDKVESPMTLNMNFDEFGSCIIDDEKYDESNLHEPLVNTRRSPMRSQGSHPSPPSHRSPVTTSKISVAKSGKSSSSRKSKQSSTSSTNEGRHSVVTQYDHRTRVVTDVPRDDARLVSHHEPTEDAYTLAARENAEVAVAGGGIKEGKAERRSGDAAYKQKVEREYQDMIRSLKSVAKEKSGNTINSAFMDDTRQMMARAMQQRKMAEEFEKMQRENDTKKNVGQRVIKLMDMPAKQRLSRNQERRSYQTPKSKTTQIESDNYRPDSPIKKAPMNHVDNSSSSKPVESSKTRLVKETKVENINNKKDASLNKAVKNTLEVTGNKRTTVKRTTSPKTIVVRNQSSVKFNLKKGTLPSNEDLPKDVYCGKDDSDKKDSTDFSDKVPEKSKDNSELDTMRNRNFEKSPDKSATKRSDSPNLGKGDFSNSDVEDGDSDLARSEVSNGGSRRRQTVMKRKVRTAKLPGRRFTRTSSLESKRDISEAENDTNYHQNKSSQETKVARVASPNNICMRITEVCTREIVQRSLSPSMMRKRPTKEQYKKHHNKKVSSTTRDVSNSASDELYDLMAGIVERRAKEKRAAVSSRGRGQSKNRAGRGQDRKILDWDVGTCEVGSTTEDQSSHMISKKPKTSAIHPCPTWLLMDHNVKCIHISKSNLKNDSTTAATQPSVSQTTSAATFKTAHDAPDAKTREIKVQNEIQDKSATTCITKNIDVNSDNRQSLDGFEVVIQLKKKTGKPMPKSTPIPVHVPNLPLQLGSLSSSSSTAYMSPPEKITPMLLSVNMLNSLAEKNNGLQEKGPFKNYEDLDKRPTQEKSMNLDGYQDEGRENIDAQKADIAEVKKTTSVASVQTDNFQDKKSDSKEMKCSCENFKRRKHSPCQSNRQDTSTESKESQKLSKVKNKKPETKSPKKTLQPTIRTVYHEPVKHQRTEKARLNPQIRKYIDELLELGKDGIRDIDITNSTVTTPGNSIINIPSNRSIADRYEENKRREKLNEFLKKNEPILNAFMLNNERSDTKYDLQTVIIQNRYPVPQEISKRPLKIYNSKTPISSDVEEAIKQVIVKTKPKVVKSKPKVVVNTGRRRLKSMSINKNLNRYFKNTDTRELKKCVYFMPALRFTTSEIIKGKSPKRKKPVTYNHSKTLPVRDLQDIDCKKSHKNRVHQDTDSSPNRKISPKRTVNRSSMTTNINCVNQVTSVNDMLNKNLATQTSEEDKGSKIFNNLIDDMKAVKEEQMATTIRRDRLSGEQEAGLNKMEKFADLTEKCTKRLSTLAKVLDEVRKNKMNIFDDILGSESGSSEIELRKTPSNAIKPVELSNIKSSNKFFLLPNSVDNFSENMHKKKMENFIPFLSDLPKPEESKARMNNDFRETSSRESIKSSTDSNKSCPKTKPPPAMTRITLKNAPELVPHELSTVMEVDSPLSIRNENISRDRTPILLKFANEKSESNISINIISTPSLSPVIEHESDRKSSENKMPQSKTSVKSKSKELSTKDILKQSIEIHLSKSKEEDLPKSIEKMSSKSIEQPHKDLLKISPPISREPSLKDLSKDSDNAPETKVEYGIKQVPSPVNLPQSEKATNLNAVKEESENLLDDKKFNMMDIDKFKEIMMKPFITYEEYAQQCNKSDREEISLGDETTPTSKIQSVKEEISSINSEGTLPDIIAELLKRNIIDEPFVFDVDSKVTSSLSSLTDSSVSLVDSSKNLKKEKLISSSKVKSQSEKNNKHGDSEDSHSSKVTKASLSVSSQADLEVVLEKLGMCWASSTLKKTKQSLALSSSSSSSKNVVERKSQMATFQKIKRNKSLLKEISRLMNSNSDINSILVDIFNDTSSVSSTQNLPDDKDKKNLQISEATNTVTSNMTQTDEKKVLSVKDYLTKEMADKITFSNQMPQNGSNNEHFTSLYSTKLTDLYESKVEDLQKIDECSGDGNRPRSRQRTSTPVQLFKSLTFNSSSSSCNNSNGIFSNVEDLSSVKAQSQSVKNSSATDKDELTIPNLSLKPKKSSSSSS